MPVKAKNYRALTGQGDGEAKNYTLAEMKDLCNDNLLINSDFRHGAINQKGQTSYSANTYADAYKYCIDMWMISNSGVGNTVTVNDDSITLATSLRYYFDRQLEDGTYALTISFNGVVQTRTFNVSNGSGNGTQIFQSGGQTLGVSISQRFLSLSRQSSNASFNIDFIKLEKGNSYTGMPEWNQYKELDRCIKYFDTKSSFRLPMCERSNVNTVKTYSFSLPRTHYMHKVPTISVMGNAPVDSLSGICLRKLNDVSQLVHIVGYSFEVRDWELVIKVNVDDSVDIDNTDVQLFIGQQFIICFDAYDY